MRFWRNIWEDLEAFAQITFVMVGIMIILGLFMGGTLWVVSKFTNIENPGGVFPPGDRKECCCCKCKCDCHGHTKKEVDSSAGH